MVTTNLRHCYLNSQNKYKAIKEIIFQEWQKNKESIAKLDKEKGLKVTSDTIPTELFWFVCDESEVFPVINEICVMLGNMAIICFSAFFALAAIFFGNSSYQISTVASTIAVFVSCKIPMLLLSEMENVNWKGWEKIRMNRKIKEAVEYFIDTKKPEENQPQAEESQPQAGPSSLDT